MKEMEKRNDKLILLVLLLPLIAVLIAAGCHKKNDDLYNFVVTTTTKSSSSSADESVPWESESGPESAETANTETETETEETETEETEAETTTKAETKKEVKQTTVKKTSKATTKAATKATTKATTKPKATTKKATKATKKTTKATKAKKKKVSPAPTAKPKYTQYLFVGDSRTVGLDDAVDGVSSIAKVGATVDYLKSVLDNVTKVKGKNVIFNFGVNDLGNINKYITVYKSLPKEFKENNNVIIMSVNPTDGSKYGSWNTDIDKFNKKIKANLPSGVKYLDTNSTLKKEGFSTRDGVHYKAVTYKRIARLTFVFCGDKNRKA